MTDKKRDITPEDVQNLVMFKGKVEDRRKEIDKYSFEKFDQEDKIKLFNDFKLLGGHYRYSVQLDNLSQAPISEVKIKILYPKFLILTRSLPPTIYLQQSFENEETKRIIIEFDELNENSSKQINFYFAPLEVENEGEIRTIVVYVNNKDYVRFLDSESIEIEIKKITIQPKIIPSSYVREFSQTSGIKKAIKSMGIGTDRKIDVDLYFSILEHLFILLNFQLIAKDPNKKILWFFGTDLESGEDILAIGQIISNKIEIIATSLNRSILISFLTLFSNDFKEQLLVRDIIKSEDQVLDLGCKYCGVTLPYFPKKGESIKCNKCNYQQIVW